MMKPRVATIHWYMKIVILKASRYISWYTYHNFIRIRIHDLYVFCCIYPIGIGHMWMLCLDSFIRLVSSVVTSRHCKFGSEFNIHYNDIIMGTIASQITSLASVYSAVWLGADQRKHKKLCVPGLCAGNSPETGEFPAQRASNAENVSIWWRHHACNIFFLRNFSVTSLVLWQSYKCPSASEISLIWVKSVN